MNLPEARKVLGLGPDEDPRPHLSEFKAARERIAEMVRDAPNETLGLRYQQGLMEFDQALAAMYEHLEVLGLAPKRERVTEKPAVPVETKPEEPPPTPTEQIIPPETPDAPDEPEVVKRRRVPALLVWFLVFLLGATGGGLLYLKNEQDKNLRRQARITYLEREGAVFIENRRWQDARDSFAEIERLDPGSEIARTGRRSIEAGMAEEQKQFIGYWTGQAIAELDAGRLDEAEAAIRQVTSRFPKEPELAHITARIKEARIRQARDRQLDETRKAISSGEWEQAIDLANVLLVKNSTDADAIALRDEAEAGLAQQKADRERAAGLFAQATQRDAGRFDEQALTLLREAVSLDPKNPEIRALFEKMSSYTRTLRVPDDFATPAEALSIARERDRIVLGEGTWKGPLVLTAAVVLEGTDAEKSIIECPPDNGSALTIAPDCRGAHISRVTIRHESIKLTGDDRYSAALVRGGGATFTDCRFLDASGHGLAVIEEGEALVQRCTFRDNGWNGAAAIGKGAKLEIHDSQSASNFENGVETWDGASLVLADSRCTNNSRNGAHVDAGSAPADLQGNQFGGNREFGLVITSAGSGVVSKNVARGNLLGGMVVRRGAAGLGTTGNEAVSNKGPGIVLEAGIDRAPYADNKVSGNKGGDIVAGVNLNAAADADPQPER